MSVPYLTMESSYVLFTVIIVSSVHHKLIHSSGCNQLLHPIGDNVTIEYNDLNTDYYRRIYYLRLTHEGAYIITHIDFLDGFYGHYSILPEYRHRVSIYGYMKDPSYPPWNISITLTHITNGDEGRYQLLSRPEPLVNASSCLFILDNPKIMNQDSVFGDIANGTGHTEEGRDLVMRGQQAEIFPSNSSFDVTMSWLLNGETIQTGGSFIIDKEEFVILSVPSSLHGAIVTYRASVDGTDVWTEVETRLVVVYMEVLLKPSQTFYGVRTGDRLPDIECDVTSSYGTDVMWTRGVKVITNSSILSLGLADVTMSGEYKCEAKMCMNGQIMDTSVNIFVFEKSEQSSAPVNILSTITGLTVAAVVVMAILLWKRGYWKRREPQAEKDKASPATAISSYTNLEFMPDNQQLYDMPGPSGVDVSKP